MLREVLRKFYRLALPILYAKSNYKLMLQANIFEIDKRIQDIHLATNFLPRVIKAIPIKPPFGKSMLVIAPHQDDEIIGCGGAMLLQSEKKDLHTVFIQDGGNEFSEDGFSTRDELVKNREAEAIAVSNKIGMTEPTFLRHVDLKDNVASISEDLIKEIKEKKVDVVFAPFFLDYNLDHRYANYALAEALSHLSSPPKVMGYEVWGLCIPNVILNIDSVMDQKRELLALYKSQLAGTDYVNCVTGLNMYHSRVFGAGRCKFAERFFEIPGKDYCMVVNFLRNRDEQWHETVT